MTNDLPRPRRRVSLTAWIVLAVTLALHASAALGVIVTGVWQVTALGFVATSGLYFCAWWWGVERRITRAEKRAAELQQALDQAQTPPILSVGVEPDVWCEHCLARTAVRQTVTLTSPEGSSRVQHHHCRGCDDCGYIGAGDDSQ
jgi:membrane protein implicated in regulation of membrane protease activity